MLTEISGVEIDNEGDLFSTITNLAEIKKEYDKIATALDEVKATGYGIVTPSIDELILEEPENNKTGFKIWRKIACESPKCPPYKKRK